MFIPVVALCCFLPFIHAEIETQLITEYFKVKHRNEITFFTCENTMVLNNLITALMSRNLYVSVVDINNIDGMEMKSLLIPHGAQGIVLDSDCENSGQVLQMCGELPLFFDKYAWLIFSSNASDVELLDGVTLHVNAEVSVAQRNAEGAAWRLQDVYNPGALLGGTLRAAPLGTWSAQRGFRWEDIHTRPKYLVRTNLTEITFKGMVVLAEGYKGDMLDFLYHNEENTKADNYARYYFLLFDHVRDLYKFNLQVEVTGFFGTASPNGSFNGLVGALQRREVDVGLSPLYFKIDRLPNVDTLVATYTMTFIFRHPKPGLSIGGAFFEPLDGMVWMVTWVVLVLTALVVRATFGQEWRQERHQGDLLNYTEHDWSYIALLVFGGICQQDVPRVPNMYSGRIIVFISVFFTYMLYQFYSGGLVSSLLSEPPRTIKTLADLLHSDLAVGVEDIPYEKMYFNFDNTSDPIAVQLYKKKMVGKKNGSTAWYNAEQGMDMVQQGGFAFQTDISTAYSIMADQFTNEQICEVSDEVVLYPVQKMAGAVQQDSPFKEIFIYNFMRMAEAGMIQRMQMRWTTPKPECIKVNDASSIFVGIKEFFPAVLFFIVGIVITVIIFVAEILVHRKQQSNVRVSIRCCKKICTR